MGTVIAPWKQLLAAAIEANSHLSNSSYIQLATVGCNGRPSNRTVVFRGFEENSDMIQINTDIRSRKIEELKHCPFSEICWYFSDTWEQFRINGKIEVIDASNSDQIKVQKREKAWFACSFKSRLNYVYPTPGMPFNSEQSNQEVHLDPSSGPVAVYCLLLLEPEKVDYLNLKSNQRLLFSSILSGIGEKCWTSEKTREVGEESLLSESEPKSNPISTSDPDSARIFFGKESQNIDPDHERIRAKRRVNNKKALMSEKVVMQGFPPEKLPVFKELVQEFATVCDRWFSWLPSSTQPNRLYPHSATSNVAFSNDTNALIG